MGEAKRKRSTTQKFIDRYPVCFFCAKRGSTTREHMPPKALFDNSHRPDRLVMPACDECNRGTSTADLTVAVMSRWAFEITHQQHFDHGRLAAQVRRQAPELVSEWMEITDPFEKERARQHLRNHGVAVPRDAGVALMGPLTIRQLNLFAQKATLALYFEHFRQPIPVTGKVAAYWRTKEDFSPNGAPQVLLDLLPDYGTLTQGEWDERDTFEYRHGANPREGLFGCLAKLRNQLLVYGFVITDPSILPPDDEVDWISPDDPSVLLEHPRFRLKL